MATFKISAQLKGHDQDVRSVTFPAPDTVISASRDKTVRVWRRASAQPPRFEASITTQGHDFINSLTYVKPTPEYPDGLLVSGGRDSIIEVKKPTATPQDNAERLLIGHGNNVCALDVSPKNTWVVSGGWDGQARIWNLKKWETELLLVHEIQGNAKAVWAVLALDEYTVVTGCADEKLRVFDLRKSTAGEVQPQVTIHTPAVVRAICRLPTGFGGHPSGADIASAGNDGVIRLWKLAGQQVGELHGHDSFIYSLGVLPSGEIVSSGEDRTLRIWKGQQCIQTITHPALSVWTVAVCQQSGDIATGASDSMVRIFTRSQDRVADAETQTEFEASVKASSIPQQSVGGGTNINKEKLDGPSFLKQSAGKKDGEVKMIREDDGTISAHQWSMADQKWIHIGSVVDQAASSGRKVEYQGKEYDFVFDVDIEDGKPPLKLPYNLSENPYERATKFLGDNELPISYLDSVANFITENTKGATLGQAAQGSSDPFGTESRYRPGEESQPPKKKYLPHEDYILLTQANFAPITKKILSINDNLIKSGHKEHALNPDETKLLQDLTGALGEASTSSKPVKFAEPAVALILKLVTQWPYGDRLPGLDILRCMAPSPTLATVSHPRLGNIVQVALAAVLESDTNAINENSVMMALRLIANLFGSEPGRALVAQEADAVVNALERIAGLVPDKPAIGAKNRNVQIALTSVAFNLAVLAYAQRGQATASDVLPLLGYLLAQVLREQTDPEVVYRALMGLGMILAQGGETRDAVKVLGAEEWVRAVKSGEERVKDVAAECLAYLR